MKASLLVALSLVSCLPVLAREAALPARVAAAPADPDRPAEQRARDGARHPEKLLAFARIKPGDTVVDFVLGGGYWTHILASFVGPKGVVYAFQPLEFTQFRAANALHRIDPAIVRQELEAAGFRFDGELDTWRNPSDPHTASAFDALLRGKTDPFAYRFRKPR